MRKLRRLTATALCLIGIAVGHKAQAQYQKIVLIEDFSSVTCVNCPQAAAIVAKIAKEKPDQVLTTQWHLDIPGRNDPFYAASKGDNDARADYYGGFNALPRVFVNGISTTATNEPVVRADVNSELTEDAPIGITVTQVRDGKDVDVQVTIETEDGLDEGYRLYVVAVEGMVHRTEDYFINVARSQPYEGETEFRDLFRKFVTPSEGVEVVIGSDETKFYEYSDTIGVDWAPEEVYFIAWVQDEFTDRIIQAGSSPKPPSLVVHEEHPMTGYSLESLSPNPASDGVRVALTLGDVEDASLTLHNARGDEAKKILLGRLEAGEHRIEIGTAELPAGVYTLTLSAGQYRASQKLTVVR